ncbi:hypothetical protein PFISCL1PPCAC_13921, partial [Pristionchus fissidentatus]
RYRRNGLMFEMYFDSLDVNTYVQSASYPLVALISDISGHAGLWLGISVISLVEIVSLMCMCCKICFGRKKIPAENETAMVG